MAVERRNLYRILHVQPEAPAEVIRAAYRALMGAGAHPDRGGIHERAIQLNAAYDVLGHPERRRQYDAARRAIHEAARRAAGRPTSTAAAPTTTPVFDPWCWHADRRCPFCTRAFALPMRPRCSHCGSPLAPPPVVADRVFGTSERRRAVRIVREAEVIVRSPGHPEALIARLRDLSATGLSLVAPLRLERGRPIRVVAPAFDAVAGVVASQGSGAWTILHGQLLTWYSVARTRGSVVDVRA